MKTLLRVLIVFCGLVFMACSERAQLIATDPPVGEIGYFDPELTLHFDKPVTSVQVNGAEAQPMCTPPTRDWRISSDDHQSFVVSRAIVRATLALPAKKVCLAVLYTDGTGTHEQQLCTTLRTVHVQLDDPQIIEGSVTNGDEGVDPAPLNTNGITFLFSDDVTGTIEIRMENGTSLGWIARWNKGEGWGNSATIVPRPGEQLVNGTVYNIQISVQDAGGGPLNAEITFTTKE